MAKQKIEQDFNIRHRLVGAFVLLALGVILIPMILQGNGPGVGDDNNLTKEVQEWIVDTEKADTFISKVNPVDDIPAQQQSVVIDENATPELQVVEETVAAIEQSVEVETQGQEQEQIQTIKEVVAAVESTPEPVPEVEEQPKVVEQPKPAETEQVAGIKAENVLRGWEVQIGIFSKPQNAQNLITKLNQNGFDSRYEVVDTDAGQATRVWVGPYEKRVTAARALERVKENTGVKGFIKSYP